jgi:hypothetical protein
VARGSQVRQHGGSDGARATVPASRRSVAVRSDAPWHDGERSVRDDGGPGDDGGRAPYFSWLFRDRFQSTEQSVDLLFRAAELGYAREGHGGRGVWHRF